MIPFIKLIYDPLCNWWVCGDEDGQLLTATAEFIEDAAIKWRSESLRAVAVPKELEIMNPIPTPDEKPMTSQAISINKCVVGRYIIRAGFSPDDNLWLYHDQLYPNPEYIPATLEDMAGIFDSN
jgi:hypothetical protein